MPPSGELRSNLETVIGFSEMLSETNLNKDQKESLGKIIAHSKVLAGEVSDAMGVAEIGENIAKEMAVTNERMENNKLMIKAAWAAIALLIGWSLASYQFMFDSATGMFDHEVEIIELKIQNISENLQSISDSMLKHEDKGHHPN